MEISEVGAVLGKFFKKKPVPDNSGVKSSFNSKEVEKLQYVKVFQLELSNMEETPVYDLKHQLSVGSEIGNIVINDASVSPRHATFILQQEVVSVLDHGSVAGTFVNGQKIQAGKYVILDEADVISVGDLEIRMRVGTEATPVESIPEVPKEEKKLPEESSRPVAKPAESKTPKKVVKKPVVVDELNSANSLVRVFSILSDLLLSYSVLVVFLPFDEFRFLLDAVPSILNDFIPMNWAQLWETFTVQNGVVAEVMKDGYAFLSETFHFVPLVIVFTGLRIFTTLLFGVSLSEYALGMRPSGGFLWARLGGVIRVLIGIVTGPFLIFDLPAILSRRTFKEVITQTNMVVPSKFVAILGIIFFVPLLVALAALSPLLQGLEAPVPVFVNDRIDQRVKVVVSTEAAATEVPLRSEMSQTLRLDISYDPKELIIIPDYKFKGSKNRINLKNGLTFYQRDSQRQVELEVYKTFDMKQLLGIGMKGNVFLYEKYPQIYNYVYESQGLSASVKTKNLQKTQAAFENEMINFMKTSFSLAPENVWDLMQSETFLIKGLVDFKSSFLALIEYKDFDEIGFIKLGNLLFMKITYNKQKPFDLIIPVSREGGRIFKVNYDKKENHAAVASRFYKFNLVKTNWSPDTKNLPSTEVLGPLQVFDLFNSEAIKDKSMSAASAQGVYAYYYETSGMILAGGDQNLVEVWKAKVKSLPKILEALPDFQVMEGEEDPKTKLLQNMRDLIDALDNNNTEYFGIGTTQTV